MPETLILPSCLEACLESHRNGNADKFFKNPLLKKKNANQSF